MNNKPLIIGILLVLASELTFALVGAQIKYLSQDVSAVQIVFFRNLFALVPLAPWLLSNRTTLFKTPNMPFHLLRAFTGILAMFIYTYALSNSTLVNGAMTLMLAPFFIPIIAYFWLKQPQSKITITCIILGFIGATICLTTKSQAGGPDLQLGLAALILFGAVLIAISKTTISRMISTEPSKAIVAYFSLISIVVCGVMLPFSWHPLSLTTLLLLVTLGISSSIGQLMMTKAFTKAGASTIGMFSYSSILFAALLGALWWQEYPTLLWFIGASIVLLAGYLAIKYNRTPYRV
ncbi:DMT family transporter [Psychrobium sp. nBUS_13]|uniref:DMT family transporter n=1 Tax=Psychrobium sp. nBUS_13 TaxID=3395319 RepID=UPI003EBD9657